MVAFGCNCKWETDPQLVGVFGQFQTQPGIEEGIFASIHGIQGVVEAIGFHTFYVYLNHILLSLRSNPFCWPHSYAGEIDEPWDFDDWLQKS